MIDKHEMVFLRDQIHNALRLLENYEYAQAFTILKHTELSMTEKIKEHNRKK